MSVIQVKKLTPEEKNDLQIPDQPVAHADWSVWECAPSSFDWQYSDQEKAYLYEGKVIVKTSEGDVQIQAGDFVVFPKGLECSWEVLEQVKKVYKFE